MERNILLHFAETLIGLLVLMSGILWIPFFPLGGVVTAILGLIMVAYFMVTLMEREQHA